MSQTVVQPTGQPIAVAGQLSDNQEAPNIVSRFNEEASAALQFGIGVKPGTARDGVKLPSATSSVIEGINLFGFNHLPGASGDLDQSSTPPGVKSKGSLKILQGGRAYVLLDASGISSIAPNVDRGYCRATTNGGNTVIGAWNNADDSGHMVDCTKQSIFRSGLFTSADGVSKIAELEVDFVNKP